MEAIPTSKEGHKDFSEVIAMAKTCEPPTAIDEGEIVGGFAHAQVFALADKIVEAVKSGAIKKFVVMSGCDGRMTKKKEYLVNLGRFIVQRGLSYSVVCE